jgi:acyl-CoA synthetase (NDP forming)
MTSAADTPERSALDLSPVLAPKAIAVIGASENTTLINGQAIDYMLKRGYPGKIYPVHPRHAQVQGLPCYPALKSLPGPVDTALVVVAGRNVPGVLLDCGAAGIPFAVVLSAGFAEIGEPGMELQRELDAAIAKSGVRVVGPNCVGIASFASGAMCGFGAALGDPQLKPGPVAIVSQSGGVGLSMMAHLQAMGMGCNYLVSYGNEADLTLLEFVDHMLDRDDVGIIVVYIESTLDGKGLRRIGRHALSAGKPVLIMKTGNSGASRRAAASHTGRLTADYELFRMTFSEGGFIEVSELDELVYIAKVALVGRMPRGRNVAVLTASGGWGVMMADHCERNGLTLPSPTPETIEHLRGLTPSYASLGNPVDMTPQGYSDQYAAYNKITEHLLADPGIDQLIVRSGQGSLTGIWAQNFLKIYQQTEKPVIVSWSPAAHLHVDVRTELEANGAICIPYARDAARAAGAWTRFCLDRDRALEARKKAGERPFTARVPILEGHGKTLDEHASKAVLAAYGIPVGTEVVLPLEQIRGLAESPVPLPVVVKIVSPDIPHKTEAGAVRLNLQTLTELRSAAEAVVASAKSYAPDARIEGVLIQQMAQGTEIILGGVSDPNFGPHVLVGLGGVLTEVLHDVSHRFAPIDATSAREMIAELKGAALLQGFRGSAACDIDALADALVRLSWLIADHADRIAEIDVNPLFVGPAGGGAVAADALVVLRKGND